MASFSRSSTKMAFCGVMTALSVVLMALGGLIPLATYVTPLMGGALLLPVFLEFGQKSAWTMWMATSIIALVIGADKEAAFFYLFLGYYPLIKPHFDRIERKSLRILTKLGYFALASGAMYGFLIFILRLDAIAAEFRGETYLINGLFFLLLTFCMLVYDRLLLRLLILYARVLRPKLKFLRR